MAALDPTEEAEPDKDGNVPTKGRSTLRILKQRMGDVSDSDDEEDDYLQALLDGAGADSDDEDEGDEDEDDDEEPNGGPSDPSKSKKARQEAAIRKLIEATQNDDEEDEDMEDGDADAEKPNGVAKPGASKGKEPATSDDESDSDDDSDDGLDLENFVVCTLDTDRVCALPPRRVLLALTYRLLCRATSSRWTSPSARTRRPFSSSRALTPSTSRATMSSTPVPTTRTTAMMMTRMTMISRPMLMSWTMKSPPMSSTTSGR